MGSRKVREPYFQCGLLKLFPGKSAESIGASKPADVVTCTVEIADGGHVHGGHYAAL